MMKKLIGLFELTLPVHCFTFAFHLVPLSTFAQAMFTELSFIKMLATGFVLGDSCEEIAFF